MKNGWAIFFCLEIIIEKEMNLKLTIPKIYLKHYYLWLATVPGNDKYAK